MPTFTIIIPAYNVQEYILRCLNSVQRQTFENFECIIVDDGSTDNTLNIIYNFVKNDTRFKVITQENMRQGAARNKALDIARGDWIAFLDSDDWYESNFLEVMLNNSKNANIGIVCCGIRQVNNQNIVVNENFNQIKLGEYSNFESVLDVFLENPSPCNKIYKSHLWKNIRFPEEIRFEDFATTFKFAFADVEVRYINDTLYNYFLNEVSTMNRFDLGYLKDKMTAFRIIENYIEINDKVKNEEVRNILTKHYLFHVVYLSIIMVMLNVENRNKAKQILNIFKKDIDKKYFNLSNLQNYKGSNKQKAYLILFLLATNLLVDLRAIYITFRE